MSLDVRYRDADARDAEVLAAFWRDRFVETFGHTYAPQDLTDFLAASYGPERQYADLLAERSAHRLAWSGAALVGACQVGPLSLPIEARGGVELKRLYLTRDAQGRGVADALMDWAVAWARAQGALALLLGVWSENYRAQRFYARHGFVKVGEYGFPVGATVDLEWILRRDLV